jgi:flagellum-specific peptidoglycan hydrolase FlgJ
LACAIFARRLFQSGIFAADWSSQFGRHKAMTTNPQKHRSHHAKHSAANAQFIAEASIAAVQSELMTGTPAAITIAQAVLESGWGKHHIGRANNYFGVKAQTSGGQVTYGGVATGYVNVDTREHLKGKDVVISQPFRSYSSMGDSFVDHGQFLAQNRRYLPYLQDYQRDGDVRAFARGLQKAGYATDPLYAELLISIIDQYKLDQYNVKKPPVPAGPTVSTGALP